MQLCFTALTLKLLVLSNSEIVKMEFSMFWIWGDLRRFSWKSTFFEGIWGEISYLRDLRRLGEVWQPWYIIFYVVPIHFTEKICPFYALVPTQEKKIRILGIREFRWKEMEMTSSNYSLELSLLAKN